MIRTTYRLCVVFSIVSPSLAESNARKYSMEEESLKMYGQDFQTVLKRFRRTPDYLRILEDKMSDIKMSTKEIGLQVFHYTHGKMEERVINILRLSKPTAHSYDEDKGEKDSNYYPRKNYRREYAYALLDTPDDAKEDASETKIQNLDNYKAFNSVLSVSERNQMKNLGFELAGSIIHTMIQTLDDQKSKKSTSYLEESGSKSTTVHPKKHEITSDTTKSAEIQTEPEETHIPTSPSTSEPEVETTTTAADPEHLTTSTDSVEAASLRANLDEINPPINNYTQTIYIY